MFSIETIHWHTLAPGFLTPASRVLDLGANYGMFSHAITKRIGCKCVAVEPSPVPFNGIPPSSLIQTIHAAVAGHNGTMGFRVDPENGLASALSTEDPNVEVRVTTLPQLLDELQWETVDLIKVDIEGSEIEMLEACSDHFLSDRVSQISIEFHDFCGVTPPEIVAKTIDRLRSIGFESIRMSRIGHQDTWLVNRNRIAISKGEILFHTLITRNWFGLKRMAYRVQNRRMVPPAKQPSDLGQ